MNGNRPGTAARGWQGGHRRWERRGISRAQRPGTGSGPLTRRFVVRTGEGAGENQNLELERRSARWGSGGVIVRRAASPYLARRDQAHRQERQNRSRPGTHQQAEHRASHPTPRIESATPLRTPVANVESERITSIDVRDRKVRRSAYPEIPPQSRMSVSLSQRLARGNPSPQFVGQ